LLLIRTGNCILLSLLSSTSKVPRRTKNRRLGSGSRRRRGRSSRRRGSTCIFPLRSINSILIDPFYTPIDGVDIPRHLSCTRRQMLIVTKMLRRYFAVFRLREEDSACVSPVLWRGVVVVAVWGCTTASVDVAKVGIDSVVSRVTVVVDVVDCRMGSTPTTTHGTGRRSRPGSRWTTCMMCNRNHRRRHTIPLCTASIDNLVPEQPIRSTTVAVASTTTVDLPSPSSKKGTIHNLLSHQLHSTLRINPSVAPSSMMIRHHTLSSIHHHHNSKDQCPPNGNPQCHDSLNRPYYQWTDNS